MERRFMNRYEIEFLIERGDLSNEHLEIWEGLENKYGKYVKAWKKYEKNFDEYNVYNRMYSSLFEFKLVRGIIHALMAGILTFGIVAGVTYYISKNNKIALLCGAVPALIFAFLNLFCEFIRPVQPDIPSKSDFLTSNEIEQLDRLECMVWGKSRKNEDCRSRFAPSQ